MRLGRGPVWPSTIHSDVRVAGVRVSVRAGEGRVPACTPSDGERRSGNKMVTRRGGGAASEALRRRQMSRV